MKKQSRKSKMPFALRRKAGYVVGASLFAAGVQAYAADAVKPLQLYDDGTNTYNNWIELSTGGLITDGNKAQAEQRTGLNNTGMFGGIADLHYQTEVAKKTTLTVDGHSIFDNHNYKIGLGVAKEDFGFIRFSFENFRVYDADNGGYTLATGAYPSAGDALALDRGKISLEAGYNKEGKPKVTFKYTHTYRNGDKGSTEWGPVHDPNDLATTFRLFPSIYNLDEKSDAFQLDLSDRIKKTAVGLGFRFETSRLNDARLLTYYAGKPGQQKITDQQDVSYDMESVHAYTETWLKPTLFLSTGFMFANVEDTFTGNRIYGDDFDVVYSAAYPANYYGYYNLDGMSHQHEYVFNVNLMSLPAKNFTITPSVRVQKEDRNAQSTESVFDPGGASELNSFNNNSGYDSLDVRERLEARYTGFTNWVLTATADLTEGEGNLNENGGITAIPSHPLPGAPDGQLPVQFAADDSRFFQKYALSARWYPVRQASVDVGGYYKDNHYNYANSFDSTPNNAGPGYSLYPGFLVYQGFQTWDGNTRLTLHPFSKVTLVSRYEYQLSTISTRPDASSGLGEVDSSRMHSHILGQNVSWTPLNWLSLQAGANYVVSETETPTSTYTQSILNSQNNYWTVNFNAGFVLDDKTDLNLGYYYYRAADGQNSIGANGVPLGTDALEHSVTASLTRRITKNLRWNVKYAYTHYDDFASSGSYNFDASVISTSLQYRF
jgi:hypothetical protein